MLLPKSFRFRRPRGRLQRAAVCFCLGVLSCCIYSRALSPSDQRLPGQELSSAAWFLQNDSSWTPRLSQPKYQTEFEWDVRVPLRDGVTLSANIWRPQAAGKFPIILMYTPYNNSNKSDFVTGDIIGHAKYFTPRGYVFVAIDTRGRYHSGGTSYFYWNTDWRHGKFEGQDLYDCLTWLGEQPWSSGKIGMTGGSYLGFVQWMVAPLRNAHLVTIIPYTSPDDHYDNFFPSGAFRLSAGLNVMTILSGRDNKVGLVNDFLDWSKLYRHFPLRNFDELVLGKKVDFWQDFMDHPDNDDYWRFSVGERIRPGEEGPGKYAEVQIPTLNITGWYDTMQQSVMNNYMGMVRYGPAEIRNKHHLIVGPWFHEVGPRKLGDLDFGLEANVDFFPIELRWYDYWLKGIDNGVTNEAPVSIFVMGKNRWRRLPEWPPRLVQPRKYYFHSRGKANTRFGNGGLNMSPPGEEPADSFVYDPEDPVPTLGGNTRSHPLVVGPRDQRTLQERPDVLVFTSEPLEEDTEVTGRILATLYTASTAPDTDFTAKLVDVVPTGYAQILKDGIVRARYRNSFKKQELITPGKIYEYIIDLWSVSHVFTKDHRIQVEVSSSNFPKYDRNPNTGHRFGEDAELQKAKQTVYHDARHPSHIVLPIAP